MLGKQEHKRGRAPIHSRLTMTAFEKEEASKLEAILTAAQKKFGQYGLAKTTMNDIASELGMGKASIYYYFPNKEALYEAVILKEQEHFIQEISKSIKASANAANILRSYSKKRVALFESCFNLSKLSGDMLSTVPCVKRLVEDFGKKESALLASILELGIQNKEFQSEEIQEKADLLATLMLGIRMVAKKRKEVLDKEDYAMVHKYMAQTIEMFIKSIQP